MRVRLRLKNIHPSMNFKLTKPFLLVCFVMLLRISASAQITKLVDYQNNISPTIGTFQGITFREAGFSGLYPIAGTNGTEFWTLSDRGVNVDCASANTPSCRPTYDKMYAFPSYAPKIHRIRITGNTVVILQTITIKRPNGTGATGIINPTGLGSTSLEVASTDTVLNCANFNLKTTPKDTFGIDPEGIVVDKDGNFWLCEEGGATIWKVNPNGVLLKRYTPYANLAGAQSVDVQIDTVFKYRKNNRGFEGIAITPNGKIYAIIQSPILYPTQTIGEASRIHRILEIDPTNNAMRTIVYLNDGIIGASGGNQIRLRDWKIGDMAAVNDSVFLVLEAAARGTTDIKRLYQININQATNVTSGLYGTQTLEALVDSTGLANKGITAVKKTLVMDLLANGWPSTLDKAEGLAIINDSTIAICNDNDFGQTCPNADGIAIATSTVSHVVTYSLSGANKLQNFQAANPPSNAIQDYSFVVLGCNRVETDDSVGNPSTANVYQLNRVFTEISQMNPLPKYLFFAGDMVLGYENDTVKLASQLSNWLGIYNAHPIKNLPIQLVAIEGNHETQDKANGKKSFVAAERTFVRIMGNYILGNNGPTITGLVPGTDSLTTDQSKLTYSFNFKNDHFVIVNTDPVGRDGKASYKWIANDIATARANGARHVFAIGHKPAYTGHFKSTPDGLENNIAQRDSFWNALEKYQADAFFSAHIHAADSLQPHFGKTWQVIAGNGGSLVEPTFTTFPNAYFGYVTVHVYDNDSVNVKSWGRDAVMTATNYLDSTPNNPTTLRASYNLNINPAIRHTPLANTLLNGPFTVTATITDNISVTGAQLNYNVNGIAKTAINPTIVGSTYTFVIPATTGYGVITYNIQANDASLIKIYSSGNATTFHSFSFGPISQKGPSSSQTPYLIPVNPGTIVSSVISVTDSAANGYKMAGIPDGLGAFDNGNGTFTLLMNHEIGSGLGVTRAHGSVGAFVSKWVINKSNLTVVSGSDLIQNVNLYDTTTQTYTTYNASNPSTKAAFIRFCAADLPAVPAFYNASTGKGTQERIFMNGEENNDESRALAHIVTGSNAGTTWDLPALGKAAWENAVASPNTGDKTVVALTNDGTDGQVYFYIGTKTTTGSEVDKAGLTNGKPYGIKVTGFAAERTNSTSNIAIPTPGTRFSMVDLGNVKQLSGVAFNTLSNANGVTKFSRPEDGAWDPSNPNDFYFNTTDQIDQVTDGVGAQVGRTRVWRLRFDSIQNPALGGTIEAVLDGTEGANMFDNMTIDKFGHILLQEDVGNAAHNGKIYQYTIATDKLVQVAKHDPARFGDIGLSATAPYTQDEESSGIIDMSDILGAGMFLTSDQAHYSLGGAAVEGGQLLSIYNPYTDITAQPVSITRCEGSNATFTVSTISTATPAYQWFKDGVLIPSANASSYTLNNIALSDSGNYTVVVSDEFAHTSTSSIAKLTIIAKVIPTITPGSAILCDGSSLTLQAAVTGATVTGYQWKLNGNIINGATAANYVVTSAATGNYSVIATYTSGCSYESVPTTITLAPKPVAAFAINTNVQCITGNSFSFTNNSTITSGSVSYVWNFGDGNTSTVTSPTKTYATAGTYYVKLVVTSNNGCLDSITQAVSVNPKPSATFTINNNTQCLTGNAFQFTNASTLTSGSATYFWRLGDGTTSTLANPAKSYASANTYAVTLIVTSNFGCIDSVSQNVTVNANPAPTSPTGATTVCSSINAASATTVTYTTTLVSGLNYSWNVTGGTISGSASGLNQNTVSVIWGAAGTGSVAVTATNTTTNCSGSATLNGITINGTPTGIISGSTAVCLNSANIYTLGNITGGTITNYLWTVGGGTIISGQGTSQVNVSWSTTGAKTITCTLTNSNGCIGTSTTFNVTVNPNPTASFTGNTTVCTSIAYTYTAATSGNTYTWIPNGGAIASQSGNTVTIVWNNVTTASLQLVETFATGCTGTTTQTINVNGPLNAVISGASQACVSSVQSYSITGASATSWSVTGGSITSSNGTSATITWTGVGVQTITVNYSNGICNYSKSYSVNINPLPTPGITGSNAVCTGTTVNYSTAYNAGRNYLWTVTSGGTITAGQGTNTISVLWTAAGANSITLNESIIVTGCNVTTSPFNITVTATPSATITGANNVCSGGSFTYAAPSATTYSWSVTGGAISGSSSASSVNIVWGASTNTNGIVTLTTSNGSCNSTSSMPVTINETPVATITGPGSVCIASSNLYSATFNSLYTYTWTVTNGTYTTGANANTISVTPNASATSLTIALTISLNGTPCTGSSVKTVTVNTLPIVVITGANSVCEKSTQTYTLSGAATYTSIVTGGSILSTTATSVTILWGANNASLKVNGTNASGCSQATTLPVTVNPLPIVTITGETQVCANSNKSYSVNATANATYSWTATGGTISGASNTNTVSVNWGAAGAGVLTATVTSNSGCITITTWNITIAAQPAPVVSGNLVVCQNTNETYTVTATSGAAYNWSVTGGTITSGAGTNTISVNWLSTGSASISVTQGIGSCTGSSSRSITVNAAPAIPVVYKTGTRLFTDVVASSYQWNLNGAPISGATTNSFTALTAGNYTLTVTNAAGCKTLSSSVIANVGIAKDNIFSNMSLFPNPVNNSFTISTQLSKEEDITIKIFDLNGKLLFEETTQAIGGTFSKTIATSQFASGIYIVQLSTSSGYSLQQKISKL